MEDSVKDSLDIVPGSVIPSVVDGGTWAACFGLSWTDLLLYDQVQNQRIMRERGQYLRKMAGTMGVAAGRNEIAATFLTADAEWLFMVDADMGFAPDTVDRMVDSAVSHDVPVLGGLCFAQKLDSRDTQGDFHAVRYRIQPTLYSYVEIEDTGERGFQAITKYRRDEFQHVAATGAACILIHRRALEAVGREPFMPITDPTGGGNGTPRTFSEDLSFCIRVHAAGLAMGVDTSIKTTHYKGGIYLDEGTFTAQQQDRVKAEDLARKLDLYKRKNLSPLGLVS